jgi:hypothetical protein
VPTERSYHAPMGIWFRSPKLLPGESVLWDSAANHDQADRAVGGKMTLTSERLTFTANRMEARMGGRDWAAPRSALVGFAVADRALKEALGGGLRRRLRVNLNTRTRLTSSP